MAECGFCGKQFKNRQSVRSHLKTCAPYQERGPKGPLGTLKGSKMTGFDPADHARQQVEQEEARLKLRQLQAAHADLDAKEVARAQQAREQTQAAERARRQAELEREQRREKEEAAADRQRRRRAIIQDVKDLVIRNWWRVKYSIPPEIRARALKAVEEEFSGLPVQDLPQAELVEIAEGVRDRLYRPVMEAQDDVERKEKDAARLRVEHALQEQKKKWEALNEQLKRDGQKEKLVRYGSDFASEELDEMHIRPSLERYAISEKVKERLRERLTGNEGKGEVEDLVEEILAQGVEED